MFGRRDDNKKQDSKQQKKGEKVVIMESDSLGYSVVEERQSLTETLTNAQWESILKQQSFSGYLHSQVYYSFLKGLPDKMRMRIWLMMSGVKESEKEERCKRYRQIQQSPLKQEDQHQINVDILRSYGNNEKQLYTKPILFRVLKGAVGRGISYTQGMNYIALHILIFCLEAQRQKDDTNTEMDEELESGIVEIFIHTINQQKFIFGENLANIFVIMKELQELMMEIIPEVTFHIGKLGLDCCVLFAQNYFALMMYSSPPHSIAKTILDLFLLEGKRAIHALLIRMLELTTDLVLKADSPEKLQKFVKFDIFNVCAEKFQEEKKQALCIQDFGLSFYTKTQLQT